jgi:hypothetical protein
LTHSCPRLVDIKSVIPISLKAGPVIVRGDLLSSPRYLLYPLLTLSVQFVVEPFHVHVNYRGDPVLWLHVLLPEPNGDATEKIFVLCNPSWRQLD